MAEWALTTNKKGVQRRREISPEAQSTRKNTQVDINRIKMDVLQENFQRDIRLLLRMGMRPPPSEFQRFGTNMR